MLLEGTFGAILFGGIFGLLKLLLLLLKLPALLWGGIPGKLDPCEFGCPEFM